MKSGEGMIAAQGPAPPPGLKLVKTGEPAQEGPRPKAINVFTDLRLYRVGKFSKKLGPFYKKKCAVFVYFRCCVLVRFEGVCDFNRHKKSSQISLQ